MSKIPCFLASVAFKNKAGVVIKQDKWCFVDRQNAENWALKKMTEYHDDMPQISQWAVKELLIEETSAEPCEILDVDDNGVEIYRIF